MWLSWVAFQSRCHRLRGLAPVAVGLALTACTYSQAGSPNAHYSDIKVALPKGNRVEVCSGYHCANRSSFTFNNGDLQKIAEVMNRTVKADTPADERRGIAQAIAWIESRVGPGHRAGDRARLDSFDAATNTTSYLLIMESYGLLRNHTVERPISKGLPFGARGYAAVIVEKKKKHRFIVDSSRDANGKPPLIAAIERW